MNQQNDNNAKAQRAGQARSSAPDALGAHPIGVGIGAASGAAAGAVGGSLAGPVGTVAGAAVGAVVGSLAGSAAAQALDPTVETAYWRDAHPSRPYANTEFNYDEYAPAYRYGWESFSSRGGNGKTFESVEADLGRGWDKVKGASRLGWDKAKSASQSAWLRVATSAPSTAKTGPAAGACNA